MVCSDVAEIILTYVRDFNRYEKMEMLYQRYKKNFKYVYCPAVPNDADPENQRFNVFCARRFSRSQRLVYLWALKVARLGFDWRHWTERLVSETDFKMWEDEFFYTGIIWANHIFGSELSFLRETVVPGPLPALELF